MKLVDVLDLDSSAVRRVGSSPTWGTKSFCAGIRHNKSKRRDWGYQSTYNVGLDCPVTTLSMWPIDITYYLFVSTKFYSPLAGEPS